MLSILLLSSHKGHAQSDPVFRSADFKLPKTINDEVAKNYPNPSVLHMYVIASTSTNTTSGVPIYGVLVCPGRFSWVGRLKEGRGYPRPIIWNAQEAQCLPEGREQLFGYPAMTPEEVKLVKNEKDRKELQKSQSKRDEASKKIIQAHYIIPVMESTKLMMANAINYSGDRNNTKLLDITAKRLEEIEERIDRKYRQQIENLEKRIEKLEKGND